MELCSAKVACRELRRGVVAWFGCMRLLQEEVGENRHADVTADELHAVVNECAQASLASVAPSTSPPVFK